MMLRRVAFALAVVAAGAGFATQGSGPELGQPALAQTCSAAYPDFCVPPPPPDLDCTSPEIGGRKNFTALPPDPHQLDGSDNDQLACEDPTQPRFPTTTTAAPATTTTTVVVTPTTTATTAPATTTTTRAPAPGGRTIALTG